MLITGCQLIYGITDTRQDFPPDADEAADACDPARGGIVSACAFGGRDAEPEVESSDGSASEAGASNDDASAESGAFAESGTDAPFPSEEDGCGGEDCDASRPPDGTDAARNDYDGESSSADVLNVADGTEPTEPPTPTMCIQHRAGSLQSVGGSMADSPPYFARNQSCPTQRLATSMSWLVPFSGEYEFEARSSGFEIELLLQTTLDCRATIDLCTTGNNTSGTAKVKALGGDQLLLWMGAPIQAQGSWTLQTGWPNRSLAVVNRLGGDCLGMQGDASALQPNADVEICTGSRRRLQQWYLRPQTSGTIALQRGVGQERDLGCLTPDSADPSKGDVLSARPCVDQPEQQWNLEHLQSGFFRLRNMANTNQALGVKGIEGHPDGQFVEIFDADPLPIDAKRDHEWLLVESPPDGRFKLASFLSGLCLTAHDKRVKDSEADGARIEDRARDWSVSLEPCDSSSPGQEWLLPTTDDAPTQLPLASAPEWCLVAVAGGAPLTLDQCDPRTGGSRWSLPRQLNSLVTLRGALDDTRTPVPIRVEGSASGARGSPITSSEVLWEDDEEPIYEHLWMMF